MKPLFDQMVVRKELKQCLASYFDCSIQDVNNLLSDLLTSLEAEVMLLEKYVGHQENPNFGFARDSICTVAKRLHSDFLNKMLELLDSSDSREAMEDNIAYFLQCIHALRQIVI